jgi:hypothetical protein
MTKASSRRAIARNIVLLIILMAVALAVSGCDLTSDRSDPAGPDWSRGLLLGVANINNRPALAFLPESNSTAIVWPAEVDGQWAFEFVRVDANGQSAVSLALPLHLLHPTQVKLFLDAGGQLHLLWIGADSAGQRSIYYTLLSPDGAVLSDPKGLTSGAGTIEAFTVAEAIPGMLDLFWSGAAATDAGLYHARIAASGEQVIAPQQVLAAGEEPASATDSDGTVHLAWHETEALGNEHIFYAAFDPLTLQMTEPVEMASFPGGTGLATYPPEVGLETGRVYVLWSTERRAGGLNAGTAQTYYETFDIGHPEDRAGGTLLIPDLARPLYESWAGPFNNRAIAVRGEGQVTASDSGTTYMPYVIPGQRSELGLVAASYMALPKRAGLVQIAFISMQNGQLVGYEVAARTRSASMRPIAVADGTGAVHTAWLDAGGFSRYEVYYASTSPSVRNAINQLTAGDIVRSLLGKTWSAATGLSFFPMLIVWLFLPFAWLVLFYLFKPDADLCTRTGRIGLAVAVVLYVFSKLFMLPSFLWYVPFLDIVPVRLQDVLVFGFPVLLVALASVFMLTYIRRSDRKIAFVAFTIFAATDSLLSLVLYMPNAVGA